MHPPKLVHCPSNLLLISVDLSVKIVEPYVLVSVGAVILQIELTIYLPTVILLSMYDKLRFASSEAYP
jgi:hypothetical protein